MDVKSIISQLKKDYKSISKASDIEDPSEFVSLGNLAFDLISDGGVPFGYVVEFVGLSQSGKSTCAYNIIANAQKEYDAIGVLIDRENAYTNRRGEQIGIDTDRLILVKPQDVPTVTDCFQFILDVIEKVRKESDDTYLVIAIDSISSFGKDVDLSKSDSGRKAKATHEGLREVLEVIDKRMMLLVLNQVLYKVGVTFGDPRTTSSGESLKYYSQVRFALEDVKKIKNEHGDVIGNWIGVEVIKTRLGPCYRTCYIPHYYDTGFDYYGGYARLLADRGYLIPKNKNKFSKFETKTLLYGDEQVREDEMEKFLEKHPELRFDTYPPYKE